jgi:hypothetical protein
LLGDKQSKFNWNNPNSLGDEACTSLLYLKIYH